MSTFHHEPTVKPAVVFDAVDDAKTIRGAMKGLGDKEKTIIQVLTTRSNAQRQQITAAFASELQRDLIKDLGKKLGGKLEVVILALMETPSVYLAHQIHDAMAGLGTNEAVLTQILCTYSNDDIQKMKISYQQKYSKALDEALKGELSGDYEKLIRTLITNVRNEEQVEPQKAIEMAATLYKAGEFKAGTNEETFITMLTHESLGQIKLIMTEYEKLYGRTLQDVVKSEFSGDFEKALVTILQCAENPSRYYAEQLEKSMKGIGTRDADLIRIIVARSEIDLGAIKREYKILYGKTLYSAVKSEVSGDYRDSLLSLIGNQD